LIKTGRKRYEADINLAKKGLQQVKALSQTKSNWLKRKNLLKRKREGDTVPGAGQLEGKHQASLRDRDTLGTPEDPSTSTSTSVIEGTPRLCDWSTGTASVDVDGSRKWDVIVATPTPSPRSAAHLNLMQIIDQVTQGSPEDPSTSTSTSARTSQTGTHLNLMQIIDQVTQGSPEDPSTSTSTSARTSQTETQGTPRLCDWSTGTASVDIDGSRKWDVIVATPPPSPRSAAHVTQGSLEDPSRNGLQSHQEGGVEDNNSERYLMLYNINN
jgi:hypothetical protein